MIPLVIILGLIIGSFLNAVIFRFGKESVLKGRSRCPKCGNILGWQDLIPVLSYIILKGKCRYCQNKISLQYPLVEISSALLFLFAYFISKGNLIEFAFLLAIFSLLLTIFVYDLKHYIIPDRFVFLFISFSIFYSFIFSSEFDLRLFLYNYLLAGGLYFSFFALIFFFSKGKAMGFGDAKLGFGMGVFLGLSSTLVAFLISFWIGAIFSIVLITLKKKKLKSEIPLGPFLVTGFFFAILLKYTGINLVNFIYGI